MTAEWGNKPGFFVTLEGGEGSGKSALIKKLVSVFANIKTTSTFEPGGTAIGLQVRRVIMDMRNEQMHPMAELLLFSAARAQLVREVIQPALKRGELVICDRFYDSSFAYQGYGHGLKLRQLRSITYMATDRLVPNTTLLLDIDPKKGLTRKATNGAEWNRLDNMAVEIHKRVRQGYLKLAKKEPGRILVINADQGPEQVFNEAHDLLMRRMIAVGYLGSL